MGGFYIDFSENAHFINIVHIYLWLFLFGMPIIIVMDYSGSITAIVLTSFLTAAVILIIKLITNRLHFLFDTSEAIEIVKKDENAKDDNSYNYPFSFTNEEHPRPAAIDQESMFPGGSIEDIQNAQVHRDPSRLNISGDPPSNASPNEQTKNQDNKDGTNQSNAYQYYYPRIHHHLYSSQSTQQQSPSPNTANVTSNRNSSTDFCILEQVSHKPSLSRSMSRRSSARFRIIDNQGKNSIPVVPLQPGCFKANICLTERYPKFTTHRSIDYCRNELRKLNEEISKLNIEKMENFEPSTADIELLDRNVPNRRSVKSISRSRSSSQRYCHSIHLNPPAPASRVGSMRAGMLAKLSPDPSTGIRPHRASISGTTPLIGGSGAKATTFTRKLSVPHVRQHRQSFSQSYPPSSLTPGVIRSQSVRGGTQTHIIRRRFSTTDDSMRRRSSFKMDPTNTGDLFTIKPGTTIVRQSSFTGTSRRRREFRAASIDVPFGVATAGNMRPIFTIGACQDECGPGPLPRPPGASAARRKASFDMKSRSLDVPEELYLIKNKTRSSLMLGASPTTIEEQQQQQQQQQQPKSTQMQQVPRRKSIGLTRSNAIIEQQPSTASDEEDENDGSKEQEGLHNLMDEMLSAKITNDDEMSALFGSTTLEKRDLEEEDEEEHEALEGSGNFTQNNRNNTLQLGLDQMLHNIRENTFIDETGQPELSEIEMNVQCNLQQQQLEQQQAAASLTLPTTTTAISLGHSSSSSSSTAGVGLASSKVFHGATGTASASSTNQQAPIPLPPFPLDIINPASHDDTSEGSVHLFQDESGDWMVYVFGDSSGAVSVTPIETYLKKKHLLERKLRSEGGLKAMPSYAVGSGLGPGPSSGGLTSGSSSTATIKKRSSAGTTVVEYQRCDSPHPDKMVMLAAASTSNTGVVATDTTSSIHQLHRVGPAAPSASLGVSGSTGSNNQVAMNDYPALSPISPRSRLAAPPLPPRPLSRLDSSSSPDNNYVNIRRLSNGSMEQISMLDRILMTTISNDNSNRGLLSREQFDFFHSMFSGNTGSSLSRDNAGTGGGTGSAGATSGQLQLAGGPTGQYPPALPGVNLGDVGNSSLSATQGTGTNPGDIEVVSPDNLWMYEAIEKWFMRDKVTTITKQYYYELSLLPWSPKKFRVNFDRLQLTALFDRSNSRIEIVLTTLLTILVSFIGLSLLSRKLYYDLSLWCVCFTMAAAQYSLVKSVQPDACSPQHGFNRLLVFNRAVYFCIIAGSILILELIVDYNFATPTQTYKQIQLFGLTLNLVRVLKSISWFLQYLLLFLPLLHTLGWLPQLNTMLLYVIEQIDIHIFGSSGNSDIFSGLFSLTRNVVAVGIVYTLCYFSLKNNNAQHICYSVFWGLHLSSCYFLSRLPNSLELYRYMVECCQNISFPIKQWTDCTKNANNTSSKPNQNDEDLASPGSPPTVSTIVTPQLQSKPSFRRHRTPNISSKHKEWLLASQYTSPTNQNNPPIEMRDLSGATNPKNQPIEMRDLSAKTNQNNNNITNNLIDPLPALIKRNLISRIKNDLLVCIIWCVLGFAMHISSLFTQKQLQWVLRPLLIYLTVSVGFVLHYLWPQFCKPYPWLLFTTSWIKLSPTGLVSNWEGFHYWLLWLQKNVFIPLLVMNEYSNSVIPIEAKFGAGFGSIILIISSMKLLRNGFNGSPKLYMIILLTHLLFEYDFKDWSVNEEFPMNFVIVSFLFSRFYELWLKMNFVYIYIAPFQISWGSAFHAIAQLAFLPHSMFLVTQCVISSIISAPLEPFLASAIFISSYVRPIKFWEKKYRTQRLETTNTALSSQVQGISSEQVAGNLNSIFYEHLTRSLQKRLAGDLLLGRWGGAVEAGDMFILASEDLHFLVHIIEMGNGLVTFQLRGLEFAGTYCHEQETEELRTDLVKSTGFCCCNPGRLPNCLSLNVAFRLRWVAWQFVQNPFCLEGYRVTDHSASTTVQFFELRRLIVTLFVQCIIYRLIASVTDLTGLLNRLSKTALVPLSEANFMDLDPVFNRAFDEDYDESLSGVTRERFLMAFEDWIKFCLEKQPTEKQADINNGNYKNLLNSLCFGLSLVGRRSLGYTTTNKSAFYQQTPTDVFLHGLHDVFKGDVRVSKDDWIFEEVTLLQDVITPAVRIALKLYQDNLANPLTAMSDLYSAIVHTETTHVICHETEPQWRFAILNDAESLFSFRRIVKPNSGDGYRIIMFNKKSLQFKVIKINRECVRGLWSSQQREQIFLRNNDQERGSIQHSRQVLRNLVNSSCDLPIGYPIYVSPLTTSLAGSHIPLRQVAGRELSLSGLCRRISWLWSQLRYYRCSHESSSGVIMCETTSTGAGAGPGAGAGAGPPTCSTGPQTQLPTTSQPTSNNVLVSNTSTNDMLGMQPTAADGDALLPNVSSASLSSLRQPNRRFLLQELEQHIQQQAEHYHHHQQKVPLIIPTGSQRSASVDDGIIVAGSLRAPVGQTPSLQPPPTETNDGHEDTYQYTPRPSLPGNTLLINDTIQPVLSESTRKIYKITDANQILNRWHDKLQWPPEYPHTELRTRLLTTRTSKSPLQGREGIVLHRWTPFNSITNCRSFCHLTIVLLGLIVSGEKAGSSLNSYFDELGYQGKLGSNKEMVLLFEQGIAEVTPNNASSNFNIIDDNVSD